jgi:tryptophan halogenase
MPTIQNILVLGGGSAGFLAALTLKRMLPQLTVRVVRSPDIGVIGVGEGTTPFFPTHFLNYLRLDPSSLYAEAQPTWKLGIRFLWGPRREFYYTFTNQFDQRWPDLPRSHGFYCHDDAENVDLASALMLVGKAFPDRGDGWPQFLHGHYAFHIENQKLVAYLENISRAVGVEVRNGTVERVEKDERGVSALVLQTGEEVDADLFIDASGFRSELLGGALEEPFMHFDRALFCDRAVIGGWPRTSEPLTAHTTAETMNSGWCWQIEHEHWINRGYVYGSTFVSDEEARAEFVAKNPKVVGDGREPRVVRFRSGRFARNWNGNVVGIGNASGFVEPLEATALAVILFEARSLVDLLTESQLDPTPTGVALYNRSCAEVWDDIRDFLAIHYRFNTRLDTPFWQACRSDTDIGQLGPLLDYYRENGPSGLCRHLLPHTHNLFGLEGYLAMLVGQQVPYQRTHQPTSAERALWDRHRQETAQRAVAGLNVHQCLAAIRHPVWQWV